MRTPFTLLILFAVLHCSDAFPMATMLTSNSANADNGSQPEQGVPSGGKLYYSAFNGTNGRELFCTDGTAGGTYCVRDICPGLPSSSPENITPFNNGILFTADDGVHGRELWKSDGTAIGTQLVKDIFANQQIGSSISPMVEYNGAIYFSATDGIFGSEVWRSDGTTAGTVRVTDTNPGNGSVLEYFSVANGLLFFVASDGTTGWELWKTNGTGAGTSLVKDITPGQTDSIIRNFTVVGSTLFFTTSTANIKELWKSDGTSGGTVLVKQVANAFNSYVGSLTPFNGKLYFVADDGSSGRELWISDGTNANTTMIKDINPGVGNSGITSATMAGVGTELFFGATDGINGAELWKSDGTISGTVMVKDICAGASSSLPQNFFSLGGAVYFAADDGANGFELWKSAGDSASTVLVLDTPLNVAMPTKFSALNGALYYSAFTQQNGSELWRSDGTTGGTSVLVDKNISGGAAPSALTGIGSSLVFAALDGSLGREIWKSDGTFGGTAVLKDINPGSVSSDPGSMKNIDGLILFTATDGITGTELWKSNGTAAGTVQVSDINLGSASTVYRPFVGIGGGVALFSPFKTGIGYELWRSDGLTASLVKDINPTGNSSPANLVNLNGTMLFSANDGVGGEELWKSDGTLAGTVVVKDISAGSSSSNPAKLTVANGSVYFIAKSGSELWKSDGTSSGTVPILSAPNLFFPSELTAGGNYLYFSANDLINGRELWRSDGTTAGTMMVKDLTGDSSDSNPEDMVFVNGLLFFSAYDKVAGRELWVSDGTFAGTQRVKDINPGIFSSAPENMTPVPAKGVIAFTAADDEGGLEVWISDGTAAGTSRLADIATGGASSNPQLLTLASSGLYLSADDNVHGSQLWKIDLSDLGADLPQISIADSSRAEGNNGTAAMNFAVTLSTTYSKTITVRFETLAGSAVAGVDFIASSGTVTFTPGQTSQLIPIQIIGNLVDDFDRSFQVRLSDAHNAFLADDVASGTIQDDDTEPTISIENASAVEGNAKYSAISFTVRLSASSSKLVTVQAATQANTAIAAEDYVNSGVEITFFPGQLTKTFDCEILGDRVDESNETFFANLFNAVNASIAQGQATGSIIDDDEAGVTIAPITLSTIEGLTNTTFSIRLNSVPTSPVTISLNNGDPSEGSLSASTVTFSANTTALQPQTVTVTAIDDKTPDGDVTYQITPSVISADLLFAALVPSLITVTNFENKAPQINSAIIATPSPATVGRPVAFAIAASDPENQPMQILYDYGDGTSGSVAQHVYTAAQMYSVTASVSDGNSSVSSTVQIAVLPIDDPMADPDGDSISNLLDPDDDGDAFSDLLEAQMGSSSLNATDTPFGATAAAVPPAFVINRVRIALNFAKPSRDSIQIQGSLPVPQGFTAKDQRIAIVVEGVVRTFTLDEKGKAKTADGSVGLTVKKIRGTVPSQISKFICALGPGDLAPKLISAGITNKDALNEKVMVSFNAIFNGTLFSSSQTIFYRAKINRSGSAK